MFLTMAALLSGCASDDYIGDIPLNGGDVITMGMKEKKITRADKTGADAAADLGNNFVVTGYRKAGTTTDCIFDHYNVNYLKSSAKSTVSNTTGWEYVGQAVNSLSTAKEQTVKYWDTSADNYYFVAFSKGQGVADASGNKTYATFGKVVEEELGDEDVLDELDAETSAFTITGTVDQLNEAYFSDLVSVANNDFKTTTVTPRFRRVGAKLRIALYETIPGYSVTDVKFYTSDGDAAPNGTPKLYAASEIFPTGTGTVYVGYPNKDNSTEDYYLKALTSFKSDSGDPTSSLSFSPLTYGALEKHEKVTDDVYLGRTTATASYSGKTAADAYINVTPSSATSILPLTLKCDYTLVPVDGAGETIHVFGATALVPPAYTNWASNYAYTYIFKITDQTDGKAGTSETDYAGLYPITFDAVEKTDVDDGYEETVSTLGSQAPTITTYQKGAAITENGENIYNAGVIYVTVYDNEVKALTVGKTSDSNISLFEITQEGGKKGDITETVVKRCIEDANNYTSDNYGPFSYDPNNTANTVSLARVDSKLTAVDKILSVDSPFGTDITVNGAKFTAEQNKQYAIQYKNAEGKYTYKVLGVGDIKMYYYVNYTANPCDIWSVGDEKDGYECAWGVLDNIDEVDVTGSIGIKYNTIYHPEVSFGGAELQVTESKSLSSLEDGTIQGRLVFDKSITNIDYAFLDVRDLLSIELPSSLTTIGKFAFEGTGLKTVNIPSNVSLIDWYAFSYMGHLDNVNFAHDSKLTEIGHDAFNSSTLTSFECPSLLETIRNSAFIACRNLTSLCLNETLNRIESSAFANSGLLSVELPAGLRYLGSSAFHNNQSLHSLVLTYNMCDIGSDEDANKLGAVFQGNNVLKTVGLKNKSNMYSGNATMHKGSFSECSLLYTFVLPANITQIKETAFGNCADLHNFIFMSNTPPTLATGKEWSIADENDIQRNSDGTAKIGSDGFAVKDKNSDGHTFPTYLIFYVPNGCAETYKSAWSAIYSGDELTDFKNRVKEYKDMPDDIYDEFVKPLTGKNKTE